MASTTATHTSPAPWTRRISAAYSTTAETSSKGCTFASTSSCDVRLAPLLFFSSSLFFLSSSYRTVKARPSILLCCVHASDCVSEWKCLKKVLVQPLPSLFLCAVVFCYGLTTSAGRCCAPQHPAPHTSLFLVWHLGVSGVHCHTHCVSLGASWKAFTPSPPGSVECLNHCLCLAYRRPCWEQGLCMETPWGMCFLGQIAYPLTVWWCSLLCWDLLLVALCGEILFAAKLFLAAAFFFSKTCFEFLKKSGWAL